MTSRYSYFSTFTAEPFGKCHKGGDFETEVDREVQYGKNRPVKDEQEIFLEINREKKMKEVGVTAGVLKVIAAVEGATGGASAAAKQKGTKRAAIEDGKQPKLSKFFGKK